MTFIGLAFSRLSRRSRPDLMKYSGRDEQHERGEIVALCEWDINGNLFTVQKVFI